MIYTMTKKYGLHYMGYDVSERFAFLLLAGAEAVM